MSVWDLVMDHLVLMGVNPWVPAFLEAGLPQPACLSPPAPAPCFFFLQKIIIVK